MVNWILILKDKNYGKYKRNPAVLISYFILSVLFLSSCGSSKYLKQKETILTKNSITISDDHDVADKVGLKGELSTFIRQNPNSNFFLLFPREYFHLANSEPGDTSRWKNFLRNSIGEEPAIYKEEMSLKSAEGMQKYLRNNKGYYDAEVNYVAVTEGSSTKVDYVVKPKNRYQINSVDYISYDEAILQELYAIKDKTLLKKGTPINKIIFDQEKQRISTHLQNIGYAEFEPNLFKIYGDSTTIKESVDIIMEVIPKQDGTKYINFTVGEVNVYSDYFQGQKDEDLNVIVKDSFNIYYQSKEPVIKPNRLRNFIYLEPNKPFREEDRNRTFLRLSDLDMYRFCAVRPILNSEVDSILDYNIYLTPHKNRWLLDAGLEGFYSTISSSGQRFGSSAFTSLENRNIFGGGATNKLDLEVGGEFNLVSKTFASSNFKIQDEMNVPAHIDGLQTTRLMNKLGIFSDKFYQDILKESNTQMVLGFNYQNIAEFYRIRTFNTSLGYDYSRSKRHYFNVKQFALNLNDYFLTPSFIDDIKNNQFILRSLTNNLFSGFLFRDISYVYSGAKSSSGVSKAFYGNLEISGWEIDLLNKGYNVLASTDKEFKFLNDFEFSKYVRLELDGRYYKELSKSKTWASRLHLGLAVPYSNSGIIPYIKQFYAGGPNSLRAWQIREIGPGAYFDSTINQDSTLLFYQQGDIKLELNTEYRFDLFYIFEMALFLDAGNVWTLRDPDRPESEFTRNFYKQIAIGGGWGIRLDFDYFNIRFDFGYKIRNPFPDKNSGSYWLHRSNYKGFGNFNIAVNYPF